MTITETTEGKDSNNRVPIWMLIWAQFLSLPFRILFLFVRKHNYTEIRNGDWTALYPFPTDGHAIERKIIAETGFDGCIKFYHLRTEDMKINELLQEKIFGEFHWEKDFGIFLRQFDSPNDWPISFLVFIDTGNFTFNRLRKVNSAWPEWKYEGINENDFNIIIEYTNAYSKRLTIRK